MNFSYRLLLVSTLLIFLPAVCAVSLYSQTSYIYANNGDPAKLKPSYVYQIDLSNGAIVRTYTNLDPTSIDGRGVAVIGNEMYYTASTSNCIYLHYLDFDQEIGCYFLVPGETGLGSIAFDGTNFWIIGASNKVYKCDYNQLNCAVAFSQNNCFPAPLNCDALEYFSIPATLYAGGALISKGSLSLLPDSFDAYSLAGGLKTFAFLHPNNVSTGVAWDGTYFYTADRSTAQLEKFSNSGGTPLGTLVLTGIPVGYPAQLEDLSIQYSIFTLPCRNPVGGGVSSSLYDNGPVDGQTNAWLIYPFTGQVVSNRFEVGAGAPATIHGFCFAAWDSQFGPANSVTWSISATPNGVPIATEIASPASAYLFNNKINYDVSQVLVSFSTPVLLPPGTYFLNLWNGYGSGGPLMWDQNSGVKCTSKLPPSACPSTAFRFDSGSCSAGCAIPSESFTLK